MVIANDPLPVHWSCLSVIRERSTCRGRSALIKKKYIFKSKQFIHIMSTATDQKLQKNHNKSTITSPKYQCVILECRKFDQPCASWV